ncbi:MAG: hypothetical protein AB1757_12405 [Acidobacteriota bacterium]
MNQSEKKFLQAIKLCSIGLLTLWVATATYGQRQPIAPTNNDRGDVKSGQMLAPLCNNSFIPSGARSLSVTRAPADTDKELLNEFKRAWIVSGYGMNGYEGAVLIFRMEDGSYIGKSQGRTNEYQKVTFTWNPATLAIIHTHPNNCEPKPSEQDRRVADKYGIPIFTITIKGMYMYDPAIRQTSKVLNDLDWLDHSTYPEGLQKWLGNLVNSRHRILDSCNPKDVAAADGKQHQ